MKIGSLYFLCFIILAYTLENTSAQNRRILQSVDISTDAIIDKTERYTQYQGTEIRKINIVVLEPFGKPSQIDTLENYTVFIGKTINTLHIKTRKKVIENLMLLKEGESFDALAVRETERLIRSGVYNKDSRVIVSETGSNQVDVTFIIYDKWTINIEAIPSKEPLEFRFYENNFLGLAHQLDHTFSYDLQKNTYTPLSASYTIPYIHNTFTSITAHYGETPLSKAKALIINRPFYSIVTKWAGGIALKENFSSLEPVPANGTIPYQIKSMDQDYWLGKNFQIKGHKRESGLGIAVGVNYLNYSLKPQQTDSLNFYQNSLFVLGTVAYTFRKYYIIRNVYRFGVTEDVPTGIILAFTGGYQQKELFARPYFRTRIAFGEHFTRLGNISTGIDFGAFIHKGKAEQGSFNYTISYFSDMFLFGKWGIRQFVYSLSSIGINRLPNESISLNSDNELFGFPEELTGTKKIALNFQSVFYAPFSIIGFRFAPVLLIGFGLLGDNENPLFGGPIYQSYGAGILIRNENFLFQTFQLSFALYPYLNNLSIPNYSINPLGTFDLRYPNYFMDKPSQAPY
ncbi:MAG: hypothetical protein H0V01_00420 [Bacteroidetes bacterium]|nr:hypothetical protein [Bacteroidota bacterium]HET6245660.1 hypothetical protein [Bacteroidia bacterium]